MYWFLVDIFGKMLQDNNGLMQEQASLLEDMKYEERFQNLCDLQSCKHWLLLVKDEIEEVVDKDRFNINGLCNTVLIYEKKWAPIIEINTMINIWHWLCYYKGASKSNMKTEQMIRPSHFIFLSVLTFSIFSCIVSHILSNVSQNAAIFRDQTLTTTFLTPTLKFYH